MCNVRVSVTRCGGISSPSTLVPLESLLEEVALVGEEIEDEEDTLLVLTVGEGGLDLDPNRGEPSPLRSCGRFGRGLSMELIDPEDPLRAAITDALSECSGSPRVIRNPARIGGALRTTRLSNRCPPLPLRSRDGPVTGPSASDTLGIVGSETVGEVVVGEISSTFELEINVVMAVGMLGTAGRSLFNIVGALPLGKVAARARAGVGRSNPTRRTRETAIVASVIISAARERDLGVVVNTTKYGMEDNRENSAGVGRVIYSAYTLVQIM